MADDAEEAPEDESVEWKMMMRKSAGRNGDRQSKSEPDVRRETSSRALILGALYLIRFNGFVCLFLSIGRCVWKLVP